ARGSGIILYDEKIIGRKRCKFSRFCVLHRNLTKITPFCNTTTRIFIYFYHIKIHQTGRIDQ
ncbi:MAG: hypothetical protein RR432_06680, partial [Alistipes sp.]